MPTANSRVSNSPQLLCGILEYHTKYLLDYLLDHSLLHLKLYVW